LTSEFSKKDQNPFLMSMTDHSTVSLVYHSSFFVDLGSTTKSTASLLVMIVTKTCFSMFSIKSSFHFVLSYGCSPLFHSWSRFSIILESSSTVWYWYLSYLVYSLWVAIFVTFIFRVVYTYSLSQMILWAEDKPEL